MNMREWIRIETFARHTNTPVETIKREIDDYTIPSIYVWKRKVKLDERYYLKRNFIKQYVSTIEDMKHIERSIVTSKSMSRCNDERKNKKPEGTILYQPDSEFPGFELLPWQVEIVKAYRRQKRLDGGVYKKQGLSLIFNQ